MTILGLIGIAARLPADGAPGLILVAIAVYVLTLVKDYLTGLMSVYGPVNVRNTLTLIRNYNVGLFLAFSLAMLAILTLILRSPALASSRASLLPVRSRDVNALEVAVFSGELAVLAFGGWLWFRRLPKRPSPRFGYGNIAEGLGDLAWTLAMISIAFGAAGSTSNLDWLVVTGVFVPVLINLRRQRYRAPRGTAAGSPQTAKE